MTSVLFPLEFATATLYPVKGAPTGDDEGDLKEKARVYLEENYPSKVLGWVDDCIWKFDPAVPLDEICMGRRPGGRDDSKTQAIMEAVKERKPMQPIVLVETEKDKYSLADGYHRTKAFERADEKNIAAYVGVLKDGASVPDLNAVHAAKLNLHVLFPLEFGGERDDWEGLNEAVRGEDEDDDERLKDELGDPETEWPTRSSLSVLEFGKPRLTDAEKKELTDMNPPRGVRVPELESNPNVQKPIQPELDLKKQEEEIEEKADGVEKLSVFFPLVFTESQKLDALVALEFGDIDGHDFHGNQWTTVAGLHPITDEDRARIKAAGGKAIPPAWTNVHVADDPRAPLQVIGRDSKGRVQRRYSEEHAANQAAAKFQRVVALQAALPGIDKGLATKRGQDTADALTLIRLMGLRPGSDKNTGADEKAHGATNIEVRHATVDGATTRFDFIGKDGVHIQLKTDDPVVRSIVQAHSEGKDPSERLFKTNETQVRDLLHSLAPGFKVKDLRTSLANEVAAKVVADSVRENGRPTTAKEVKARETEVATVVSARLGNTPTIAMSSYINPTVFTWRQAA